MVAYRLLHKPTGLYYCPSREIKVHLLDTSGRETTRYIKSNLGKTGKVYYRRPSIKNVGQGIYTHLITSQDQLTSWNSCYVVNYDTDWEIVEV